MKILKMFRRMFCLILLMLFCLSGFLMWQVTENAREQKAQMDDILSYKPTSVPDTGASVPDTGASVPDTGAPVPDTGASVPDAPVIVNQNIADMQIQYPDVRGWLTLDNTRIDYPFVQSKDNEDYLHSDLSGDYLYSGTIFIDYRCNELDSFVTIMYGHHMADGTMFAGLLKYEDEALWDGGSIGTVYTPTHTYTLSPVAYLVTDSGDEEIYNPYVSDDEDKELYLEYLKETARIFEYPEIRANDKLLILSTCNYEFTGARSVLVVKATPQAMALI